MIYATTFAYVLRHNVGPDAWDAVLEHELAHLSLSSIPGLRTIGSVAMPGAKCRATVHAGCNIARNRSKAAGQFLDYADCDVWISVDEDVAADGDTTARLIRAARATRGVVSAPCWLRRKRSEAPKLNFTMTGEPRLTPCDDVGLLVDAEGFRTGFGLVALHRSAIETMAARADWVEDEQGRYPTLFFELLTGASSKEAPGRWLGEDFAFSMRASEADVPVHALCNVTTDHAGLRCTLRANEKGEVEAHFDAPPSIGEPSSPLATMLGGAVIADP